MQFATIDFLPGFLYLKKDCLECILKKRLKKFQKALMDMKKATIFKV